MSAVIAWICKGCGRHAEGLSVDEYMAQDREHTCKPADIIRRAAGYFRRRSPLLNVVADWLEACAVQADSMDHLADFDACDEPASVRHALAVATATPWEES